MNNYNPRLYSAGDLFLVNIFPMNIIEIENVTKRYANHVALNNVTLHIPQQSVFGLLGPNGAGKTFWSELSHKSPPW